MKTNNSLTARIEQNYPKWKGSTNYKNTFSDFGYLGPYSSEKRNFSYLIDMITLDSIDSGNYNQAFETVLQVIHILKQIQDNTLQKKTCM